MSDSRTSAEAFLLAFVAWEAFKIRVLLVGRTAMGETVAEARKHLDQGQLWRDRAYDEEFASIFGSMPANTRQIGKNYSRMRKLKNLRNRYVHGHSRTSPARFDEATRTILTILKSDWEQPIRQALRKSYGLVHYTNPLGRLKANEKPNIAP